MKKSCEIVGLPLFSVEDGKACGMIEDLIIDAVKKTVRLLSVDTGAGCFGLKALPLEKADGIAPEMLTTENSSGLVPFWRQQEDAATSYFGRDINGSRVVTNEGEVIGEVAEYTIDERTGAIISLELISGELIPAKNILTLGRGIVFVTAGGSEARQSVCVAVETKAVDGGKEKSREELEAVFNKRKSELLNRLKDKEKDKETSGQAGKQQAENTGVKAAK
ncbi:MAG: PRC-barrel domain-containing protein [Christensenellales bacterium]|jgi:uncharacterized protein YrrD